MKNKNFTIYFITSNVHKFNEVINIFQKEKLSYELKQIKIDTIEIQAESIKEVALFKLNSIKEKISDSFFIEDAGFFIDIPLNGFPGVYSSYVFKTIGNKGIIRLIDDFDNSKAHFAAVIAFYFKPLDKVFLFDGEVEGKVSSIIRGKGGFGFDPIFIPKVMPDKTFGEMSTEEKNKISHRGEAIKKFMNFLKMNEK